MAEVDVVKLIHEYIPDSPLFARVAESEMNKGNLDSAKEILERGLDIFPDYASAWYIYSLLLAKLNDFEAARNTAKKADLLFNDKVTYGYYLTKIEHIENEIDDASDEKEETESAEVKIPKGEDDLKSLLEEFGDSLFDEESEDSEADEADITSESIPEGKIVSETMGNIHYSQGNYKEALSIFKELERQNPDKADYYKTKIAEISEQLNSED